MSTSKHDAFHQTTLQSVLMLSTGHLTKRTARYLRDHDAADWPSPGGHFGDLGWMFWVDEGAGGSVPRLPHDLMSAFECAVGRGASFIIFQDVSPVVPDLPTYSKSGVFDADTFLNRRKKPIEELEDEAAIAAQEFLSLDPDFTAAPAYIAIKLAAIMGDIAARAANAQLSALPYECLQQLSDLAITYHFHAKRKANGFDAGPKLIEELVAEIDALLANHDLTALDRHRRTREILENVRYYLRLTTKLFENGSLRK